MAVLEQAADTHVTSAPSAGGAYEDGHQLAVLCTHAVLVFRHSKQF